MTPGKSTQQAVLAALASGPPDTFQLAEATNRTPITVTSACRVLMAEGRVQRKVGKIIRGAVRQPNMWRLKPNA